MLRTTSDGSVPAGTERCEPSGSVRVRTLSGVLEIICSGGLFLAFKPAGTVAPVVVPSYRCTTSSATGTPCMPRRFRYRDEEPSSTSTILGVLAGAVGGFALGMFVAQRVGGIEGLTAKLKSV